MKSFTGIIFWSILLICSACTDENETNNGKRTDCYNGTPLTVRATATGFENVPGSEKPSTRASVTDEHLKTEFVDGDSIGIFSIKDGTIVDDINNIPLVYNVSNDSWNPVENSKTLYWYDGASYIAYYPYRKNITLDVSKDTDEAIASLTRNEKLQPSKDQSTKEKHTVSDLLIATGVPTTGNSSGIILNLQFKHQFTLLVLATTSIHRLFCTRKCRFCLPQRIKNFRNRLSSYQCELEWHYSISDRFCKILRHCPITKKCQNYRKLCNRRRQK